MGDNAFPESFFKRESTTAPPGPDTTVSSPYDPPPIGNDFNAVSLKQLARPGGDVRSEDLVDGKIPAGSVLRTQVTTECGYLRNPGPEMHLVEANGCVVWRVQWACTDTTRTYWILHGKSVLVAESVEARASTVRFVRRCPGGEPVAISEDGSIETYTPMPLRGLDPAEVARFRQADPEVTKDGATVQVRRDVYWALHYPLRQISECVGLATYELMVRTQQVAVPSGTPIGPDVITPYSPVQTQESYFSVPNCPKGHVSWRPGSTTISVAGEINTPDDRDPLTRLAFDEPPVVDGVRYYDDGSTETEYEDGTVVTEDDDGSTVIEFPDGDEVDLPEPLSRWEEYWIRFLHGPRVISAGIIVLAGLGFAIGFADHGNSTTTAATIRSFLRSTPTPAPTPTPTPTPATPTVPLSIVGGSLCVVGQGATSLINVRLVSNTGVNAPVNGALTTGAGSSLTGATQVVNGIGTIPFTITTFGTYGPLTLTSGGQAVPLGPLSGLFPFTVSSDNQPCVTAGASTPTPATSAPAPSTTPTPAPAPTTVKITTTTTTTTTTMTPPWSWLAAGGGLLLGLGLILAKPRRSGVQHAEPTGKAPAADERALDRQMLKFDPIGFWRELRRSEFLTACVPQEQAVVAAQREFDDARIALDEAERARDDPLSGGGGAAPPDDVVTKLHSQAVTDAATRQGAARLNLEIAEKRRSECESAAEAAFNSYISSLSTEPEPTGPGSMPGDDSKGFDPRPPAPEGPTDEPPRVEIG